jgi:outer membrane autotransporter protein
MGYWPESPASASAPFGSFDNPPATSGGWNIWIGAYGGYSLTEGDAGVGSHDRETTDYGVALGFDGLLWDDGSFGLAISVGGTSFSLADGFGSGSSGAVQVALYGRQNYDDSYVEGALAYGYHAVTTDRYVTVGGEDHYRAEYAAHDVAARVEVGHAFDWFVPFLAAQGHAFMTPAYSETTVSGASTFALDYDASTVLTASTELGASAIWDTTLDDDSTLSLWLRAAWVHRFGTTATATAEFQALPGSSFEVEGASAAADSIAVSAGAQVEFRDGFALAGSVSADFAENAQSYRANATLSHAW